MTNNNNHYTLHGKWTLSFTHPEHGEQVRIKATVPGNVELDLLREGIVKDAWAADDFSVMRDFERVDDWTYETEFDAPDLPTGYSVNLVFEGIDTIADVFLNGSQVLRCENMFIPHSVEVTELLQKKDNTLSVRLYSADLFARKFPYSAFSVFRDFRQSQAYLRKAAHMWGWDNAPRLLSAGIWRPVVLSVRPPVRFSEVYLYTQTVREDTTWIGVNWRFETPDTDLSGYRGRLTLSFNGTAEYVGDFEVFFTYGVLNVELKTADITLWWPKGYGEPNLYDVSLQLLKDDSVAAEWNGRMGIRELELIRSEIIDENDEGDFVFLCNGEKIYINGTNWKPLNALHSRAVKRTRQALDLCLDLNCNMVRVWGGGIYEDHDFFDYCDEQGLLVWQDFMFACGFPPKDTFFLDAVAREAESIVKRIRNHPSLAVWCGDNEVDNTFLWGTMIPNNLLPSHNDVSRKVLKNAVLSYDPYRSYVESSPHISDSIAAQRHKKENERRDITSPEVHLYPKDENFRKAFRTCRSRFVGETGPFFINAMSESADIVERERERVSRLWDVPIAAKDYTIESHQMDEHFITWKDACRKRLTHFFGKEFTFEPWQDFALGVNSICADIFKFAIEYSRSLKWQKTGVLWWSLLDMWPMMFNYSVVDYNFRKKMPYYWIRQSQQPFCLMIVERNENGPPVLVAANDTLEKQSGHYTVETSDDGTGTGRQIASGRFEIGPNHNEDLQILEKSKEPELWIIKWHFGKTPCYNHFVTGAPPFNFDTWKKWNSILLETYADNKK